jgi:hypothetical protein
VKNVQKKIAYFLPIYMVIIGSLLCINLKAQEQQADTLKPISNFKRWYQNLLPTPYDGPKNKLRIPMAVGYTNFDDNIRDLQLLGKLQPEQSLTQRPYILTPKLGYDSLLFMIDPEFENHGHLVEKKYADIQLLPINFLQKYNSTRPYGWNDGPLSFSKGYQFVGSGGVYLRLGNIHLTLRPEYFKTASEKYETAGWGQQTPSISKFILGQSSLRMDIGPLNLGVSSENIWLGPGLYSSLIMSNNAQGFNHYKITTNRPLKTPIGSLEFNIIGGTLTSNRIAGFENKFLKVSDIDPYTRYLNVISITYNPIFSKNVFLGINRAFQQPTQNNPSNKLSDYYLIALKPLYRNQYEDNAQYIDQLISGFAKFLFPKENAEVYFEYGWNDGSSNFRDLVLDMSHSAASIYGFKKIQYLNNNSYLNFEVEATQMSQRPTYLFRNAGNWYVHAQLKDGYTNENQILGAGSGIGNNLQTIAISWNKNWKKYGIKFNHISMNPWYNINLNASDGGAAIWHDYSYGILLKQKYKNILFNINIDYLHSKYYLNQVENNKSNLYFFINTAYLW